MSELEKRKKKRGEQESQFLENATKKKEGFGWLLMS